MNLQDLYTRGWTAAEAADRLGRSKTQVLRVLSGISPSPALLAKLSALPAKKLQPRRRLNRK